MSIWTVDIGGVELPIEDWGMFGCRLRYINQGADSFSFSLHSPFDAAGGLTGSAIAVKRSGTTIFSGTIDEIARSASPSTEVVTYNSYGPWRAMEETIYGQSWAAAGGSIATSHVMLNRAYTIDGQIAAILLSAASAGIGIQAGTIDALPYVPVSESRDITIGEALRMQLRWCPDTCAWVDYSTTPPSLHVRRWSSLAAVDLPLDGTLIEGGYLKPRTDLQRPAVVLFFETAGEVDGRATLTVTQQKYPLTATGFERRALIGTFDLQGATVAHEVAFIDTREIDAAAADDDEREEWWKLHHPELRNARITSLSIPFTTVKFYTCGVEPDVIAGTYTVGSGWDNQVFNEGDYAKEVDGGTVRIYQATQYDAVTGAPSTDADMWTYISTVREEISWETWTMKNELTAESGPLTRWLELEQGFTGEEIEAVAKVTYTVVDPDTGDTFTETKNYSTKVMATNATTGDYSTVSAFTEGETPPAGLAQHLYGVASVLHYEGSLTVTEPEATIVASVGNVVNIPGGAYAAAKAMVQECIIDIDRGVTSLMVGPPSHLGPQDLIEWLRAFRTRRVWTNPTVQDDGALARSGGELGRKGPSHNSTSGAETPTRIKMIGASGSVDIDPADSGGKTIEIRELDYCDGGVLKKIRVLASAPYTP